MAKLSTILDQIDAGSMLLPEFQRGYVWNRDQVRGLMRSLYRGYPVGSFLIWETVPDTPTVRAADGVSAGPKLLLLDGQQRITSLYGVIRGKAPEFFEGDVATFTGLRFNVEDETFEFYAQAKMKDDARWIDVTRLFVEGVQPVLEAIEADPTRQLTFMQRLVDLRNLLDREFHDEKITGADKSIDVVVDIFNRVNSGGTKLSKGDLALAKICAQSPSARAAMRTSLDQWSGHGFEFTLDWLLRNINAVATGRAPFSALEATTADEFGQALAAVTKYVGGFLEDVSGRLGLDHDRVLLARGGIPVVSRLLHLQGGHFTDARQRDKALYWYVQSGVWGRFAGSTETVLAQDFETAGSSGIDGLIASLERWRGGNLRIDAQDFEAFGKGSRLYPILYLLTRVLGARDLGSGLPLHSEMLGHLTGLQVHHIFPKAVLYAAGYTRGEVNAVANFCFLTQSTNLAIGKRHPQEYMTETQAKYPGALESQWIPTDPALWRTERYLDFLSARREMLAAAANTFLDELRHGTAADVGPLARTTVVEELDERGAAVHQLAERLVESGCLPPLYDEEVVDPGDGRVLIVAEAFWPNGLRGGLGEPVVLELEPVADSDLARLEELGFKVFTDAAALDGFVRHANEVASGELPDDTEPLPAASSVEAAFGQAMKDVYRRAKDEAGYNATLFLRMLAEHGPVETARRLINSSQPSDGFTQLWERHRLDLTVEAHVLLPQFEVLFTEEERARCRARLHDYGFETQ